ncbi:MAG: hypothetical protein R3A45_06875 [Bdellovibrionota bacterium]
MNLNVFEKNVDGFHRLQTLMVRVGVFDYMEIVMDDSGKIDIQVENHPEISGENNILYPMVKQFQKGNGLDFGIRVFLKKVIPMGAGLGGGSANAAYLLRFLNQYFNHPMSDQAMYNFASTLGSDVGFYA